MRYLVRKSIVNIIGYVWQPCRICAQQIELSAYDLENAKGENGKVTRKSLEFWLHSHAGDFSGIIDFSASLEIGNATVEIPWETEESECTFNDCMFSWES